MGAPATARLPALVVEGLTKHFGSTRVLADISFDVARGTVHGLIGRNGSGKSTIVKILAGYHEADDGVIVVAGRQLTHSGSEVRHRIAFVHQDLGLAWDLSVRDNLILGRRVRTRLGRIDWSAERKRVTAILRRFGLEENIDQPMRALSKAQGTIVAMARALEQFDEEACDLLVLDEPTSALPRQQTVELLTAIKEIASRGTGVIFISHRLGEILGVAGAVTVLRNGKIAWSGSTDGVDEAVLVRHMIGGDDLRRVKNRRTQRPVRDGPPSTGADVMLSLRGVHGKGLEGLDLEVRRGEVVGLTGILGSGIEKVAAVASLREASTAGQVKVGGKSTSRFRRKGRRRIGFVPADRLAHGVLPDLSVATNASVAALDSFLSAGKLSKRTERKRVHEVIDELGVIPPVPDVPVRTLSGGNQQKVVLSRWLLVNPEVLVADEPTRGIDIQAKQEILTHIRELASEGLAVLLVSSEFEEIIDWCDRLLIVRDGRVVREMNAMDADHHEIVTEMLGSQ